MEVQARKRNKPASQKLHLSRDSSLKGFDGKTANSVNFNLFRFQSASDAHQGQRRGTRFQITLWPGLYVSVLSTFGNANIPPQSPDYGGAIWKLSSGKSVLGLKSPIEHHDIAVEPELLLHSGFKSLYENVTNDVNIQICHVTNL